jgi:hypothetical protein
MPFSSGAVSYKSSATESSTIDGLEEATISCGVTAAAPGEKGALSTATVFAHHAVATAPLISSCAEHRHSQSTVPTVLAYFSLLCAGAAAVKPNTAPLAGGMTPAGGGGNTATLGLKRFGEYQHGARKL